MIQLQPISFKDSIVLDCSSNWKCFPACFSIGFRADLKPIGDLQPGLGLGYVFPADDEDRAGVHWGIVTSLTFEF